MRFVTGPGLDLFIVFDRWIEQRSVEAGPGEGDLVSSDDPSLRGISRLAPFFQVCFNFLLTRTRGLFEVLFAFLSSEAAISATVRRTMGAGIFCPT